MSALVPLALGGLGALGPWGSVAEVVICQSQGWSKVKRLKVVAESNQVARWRGFKGKRRVAPDFNWNPRGPYFSGKELVVGIGFEALFLVGRWETTP